MSWQFCIFYLGFFGLIGAATFMTGSAWCLWALLLFPSVREKKD